MRARRTPLGYQRDCQREEAAGDQEDTGVALFFDRHERPGMQQLETKRRPQENHWHDRSTNYRGIPGGEGITIIAYGHRSYKDDAE